MSKDETGKKDDALFVHLVLMFQVAAMQQMGKVQNPITQKVERNLEQARFSIDMLEMIQNRTQGNLSASENKFLEQTLFELRMNYVDELKKDEQKKDQENSSAQESTKKPTDTNDSKSSQSAEDKEKDRETSSEQESK